MLYQLVTGDMKRALTSDWSAEIADPLLREDIHQCVAGDPAHRFSGGAQLATHLRALPERRAAQEREEKLRAQALRRRKQVRVARAVAATLIVAACALSVAFLRERQMRNKITTSERRAAAALDDLRKTVPTFLAQARALAAQGKLDEGIVNLDAAIAIEPDKAAYHAQRGNLLQLSERFPEAEAAYRTAQQLDPSFPFLGENLALCAKLDDEKKTHGQLSLATLSTWLGEVQRQKWGGEALSLVRRAEADAEAQLPFWQDRLNQWLGKSAPALFLTEQKSYAVELRGFDIDDLSPLRGMPVGFLNLSTTRVHDLSPLRDTPLFGVVIGKSKVEDLSPLIGLAISSLNVAGLLDIKSWEPLRDLPLTYLMVQDTKFSDLSVLRGKKLERLMARNTGVSDLKPLAGMPLKLVDLVGCPAEIDVSPLMECRQLENLMLPPNAHSIEQLRHHPTLQRLSYRRIRPVAKGEYLPAQTAAEFWTEYDAQQAAGKK